ncbi:MAG: PAS domain S-box protein [Syntrophorhabdus aromaticivorans]|uniref:histidine kinase n=1 Tax=Syntrophorhabdus aromaticivorans TaxID=328301 RepID=A0A971S2L9_9BACT|nr:PAS domain S-box protein [Syntrophorhabdus aromaticivorans]
MKEQDIEQELDKRVRELTCLYKVGKEIRSDCNLEPVLINTTSHLIEAMQFPESASAAIHFDGQDYTVKPVSKENVTGSFACDLIIRRAKRGTIEVYYLEDHLFLDEEKRLIDEIGLRISKKIERVELTEELRHHAGKMEKLVEEKTRELEKSKKRYEDLFMDAPVPLLISRLNGDIMKANHAFYRLLGYPEDESVRLNFVKNNLYENMSVRADIYKKLMEEGCVEGLELTLLDRNGKPIPVIGSNIFLDLDGERCIESVYKDIRVRKELERKLIEHNENLEKNVRERTRDLENQTNLLIKKNQELISLAEKLKESKTRIQALFQAITDTVTVIDPEMNIIMSNQKTVGKKGKCYKKIFGLEQRCDDCLAARVFEERSSVSQEKVIDDEYYLLQAYPIFDAKCDISAILEISRVITKEKNMEKQLLQADKLASLGQLVSGIGHEINNPNTFIRGNLYIVQEAMKDIFPILDEYHRKHPNLKIARLNYEIFQKNIPILIDDMVEGANRIKGIVDGLKKFAKRDEGLLNETVDINLITEACLRLVDNQVRRTADVRVNLDPNLPAVLGNSQKLQQVIVNILINASQAIDKPHGAIHVFSRFDDTQVTLEISDDGAGMDEKTTKLIFDPFFTTKRRQGGTGLGLSIVYGIIKEHGGTITVESKPGIGTTFSISIPRIQEV